MGDKRVEDTIDLITEPIAQHQGSGTDVENNLTRVKMNFKRGLV
jgi:hypothetical protein